MWRVPSSDGRSVMGILKVRMGLNPVDLTVCFDPSEIKDSIPEANDYYEQRDE